MPQFDWTQLRVSSRGKWASSFVLFAIEIAVSVWLWQGFEVPLWLTWVMIQALTLAGRAHGIVMVNKQLTDIEASAYDAGILQEASREGGFIR